MVHLKLTKIVAFLELCLSWTFLGGQIPDTVSNEHTWTCTQQPAAGEEEIIGNQIRCFVESRRKPSLTTERTNLLKEVAFEHLELMDYHYEE